MPPPHESLTPAHTLHDPHLEQPDSPEPHPQSLEREKRHAHIHVLLCICPKTKVRADLTVRVFNHGSVSSSMAQTGWPTLFELHVCSQLALF